ncbi:MAG TPA: TlpA disulfide reductase family protein [Pyrinomonadaceae bacterium]|nr:TlpA disulfide reductase family protein [Pyrinomonadaceae bacterium]
MLTTAYRALTTIVIMSTIAVPISRATTVQTPDFSFRAVDGAAVSADSVRGQVAVFGFGASWLPLTRNQMEGLKKVADQYASRGVAVYWVSTESDSPKSKNFADDNQLRELSRQYKITVLRDPDGAISKRLGVDQLPATVIFNKQGQVAANINGLDPTDVAKALGERIDKVLKP